MPCARISGVRDRRGADSDEIVSARVDRRPRAQLAAAMGSFQFLADPFGWWRNGKLYVFVEDL
jgi:hypothetical protein